MKTRIITAAIAAALLLTVLFLPWPMVLTVATSLICVIAVQEALAATGMTAHRGIAAFSLLFALATPFFNRLPGACIVIVCFVYVMALLFLFVKDHKTLTPEKVGVSFFLTVLISISLSCMSYLRTLDEHGLFYVMLALVIAWLADSGAYFVGTFLGKHKLCPEISPKKTVEGLVGGIATSVLFSLFTAWIYQTVFLKDAAVSYWTVLGLALVGAPLSVIGDLFASVVKRHYSIKDFGRMFPGHGGMMDRFDSLLLVFPLVFFTAGYLPIVIGQ